uniref:(northern house mosquito) hypothetical protein n=1 Tax=Culex pipiens TaxID=7175 RepID=A0A8D8CW65_CULPI
MRPRRCPASKRRVFRSSATTPTSISTWSPRTTCCRRSRWKKWATSSCRCPRGSSTRTPAMVCRLRRRTAGQRHPLRRKRATGRRNRCRRRRLDWALGTMECCSGSGMAESSTTATVKLSLIVISVASKGNLPLTKRPP